MRTCDFSKFVSRYRGPTGPLEEHLRDCEPCKTAYMITQAMESLPDERTVDCPEPGVLSAYDEGLLSALEENSVTKHVIECGYCLQCLQELAQLDDENPNEDLHDQLEHAQRELVAYRLAKEIAEWLTTNAYPDEHRSVTLNFDRAYARARRTLETATASEDVLSGMQFANHDRLTLGQSIALLTAIVGKLAESSHDREGSIQEELRSLHPSLSAYGIEQDLLDAVSEALASAMDRNRE